MAVVKSLATAIHEISLLDGRIVATEISSIRSSLLNATTNSFVHGIFSDINLASRDGKLLLKDQPFNTFYDLFRRGHALSALQILTSAKEVPSAAVAYFAREAQLFPESFLEKGALISKEIPELAGKTTAAELETAAKESTKVRGFLDIIRKNIKFGVFTGLTVGLSAAGLTLYELAERYRQYMTGCFRYESVNGVMQVCKVVPLSCNITVSKVPVCTDSVLEESQRRQVCADNDKGPHCKMCDSDVTDATNPNYIPGREKLPRGVTYKCRTPDFQEALGDMLQNYVTTAADGVAAFVKDTFDFFKYIRYAIIGAIGIGLLVIIIALFRRISPSRSNSSSTATRESFL